MKVTGMSSGTGCPGRQRGGGRNGFTVVEVCIVTVVAFILLFSLWLVYSGVVRAGRSTENTSLAVARAHLATERIRTDLLLAGGATVELGEDSSLAIFRGEEMQVSYDQTASEGLVRTTADKTTLGPEETRAVFAEVPGEPWSVALTVTSTSHDRSVALYCEHADETSAHRLQHPEWNSLE